MGLFGSLFSASSSSSSSNQTTNIDKRIVQGSGGFAISPDSATVNLLDEGAVNAALTSSGKNLSDVLGFANHVFDVGAANVRATSSLVQSAYDNAKGAGDQKTILVVGVLAGVGVLALVAIRGLKK